MFGRQIGRAGTTGAAVAVIVLASATVVAAMSAFGILGGSGMDSMVLSGDAALTTTATVSIDSSVENAVDMRVGVAAEKIVWGGSAGYAVTDDGDFWSWGYNSYGNLGNGATEATSTPQLIRPDLEWATVSGGDAVYGLTTDGTLHTWGRGAEGALGDGTTDVDRSSPATVGTPGDWESVSGGGLHGLGIKKDGSLWAWGYGISGQLGLGSTLSTSVPVQIGTATDWRSVCARGNSSFAIKDDGTLWAWGANYWGELGLTGGISPNVPTQVAPGSTFVTIAPSSGGFTAAIRSDGALCTWGRSNIAFLGDNTHTDRQTPAVISAGPFVSVATGSENGLAVHADGRLFSWGYNTWGQLGVGSSVYWRPMIEQVGTGALWTSVDAGSGMCAAYAGDTVFTWGLGVMGLAGDGGSQNRYLPHAIASGWEPYQTTKSWTLAALDGTYTVPVTYRSSAGTTAVLSDSIFFDASPPTGTVRFNDNVSAINTVTVPVASSITNVVDMKLGSGPWQPYSALASITVPAGDGLKALSVTFRDEFARTTEFTSSIMLDTQAPTGTFTINAGDATTRFRQAAAVTSVSTDAVGIRAEPPAGWSQLSIGAETILGIRGDGTLWGRGTDDYYYYTGDGLGSYGSVPGVFNQTGDGATYKSAAVHDNFAAGVRTDGSLWVWGESQSGPLGVTGFAPVRLPIRLGAASNWSTVTVGGYTGAVITTGGALYTWGHNGQGQCGLGNSVTPQLTPVNVQPGTTWKAVSGGSGGTFAGIRTNGTLWTWGYNSSGQVGNNTTNVVWTPIQPNGTSGFSDWIAVSARGTTTYALRANGDLYAWGSNSYGQIGDGTTTNRLVPTLVGTGFKAVAGGEYHATAVKTDGSLWGWGYNWYGQVGDGTAENNRLTPVRVGSANNWASVVNGDYLSMAVENSGELWAWGDPVALYGNASGVIHRTPIRADWFDYSSQYKFNLSAGNGVKNVTLKVVDAAGNIGSLTDSITLNAAASPGTVVVEGGAAWAGTQTVVASITVPFAVDMTKDTPFTAVSAGGNSIGLIRGDGRLHSIGNNAWKKLGDTTTTSRSTAVSSTTQRDFVAVSFGTEHALGLASDGTLYSWGSERYGAVGTGVIGGPFGEVAARVGAVGEWAKIAAGANHSLGLKKDGSVWAWGYGGNGALGLGADVSNKAWPTKVSGSGLVFTAISAGPTYSMAVRNDGTLWVWGTGSQYQLGLGAGTYAASPTQVGTATNWSSVSAGSSHAMGLRTDGSAYLWGNNSYGQIGESGLAGSYNTPQLLRGGYWQSVSAGDDFSAGIRSDGSLWAWGRSDRYQTATGNSPTVPRRVDAATDWIALDAGTASVVALKRDGTVRTWGGNVYGELGTGAATVGVSTAVPTEIMPITWQSVTPTTSVFVERGGLDTNVALGFRDVAGNVFVVGDRIGFDYTPPVTTATGIPASWKPAPTFSLAATDPGAGVATTFYNFDGGAPTTYTSEVAISEEGTTLVGYWSVDLYGNAETPKYGYVLKDSTAPAIDWNIPASGWLTTDTLSMSATDAFSGVSTMSLWVNGTPSVIQNPTFAYGQRTGTYPLGEGSHLVRVQASNSAGAYGERTQAVSVDFTPPGSAATGIPTGWSATDAVVSITASDALSGLAGVRYEVDGSAPTTYSAPIVIGDGVHVLRWWALDVAGNAEATHTETLTIDTSFPGSVSTIDEDWRKTPQTFSVVSTDALSGWSGTSYRIDGGPDMPYSVPVTVSDEGTHVVEYWAWDLMGNVEFPKKSAMIRIDYSPPHTALLGAPAGVSAAAVELAPMATDAGVGVKQTYYRLNGGQVRPFTADQTAIVIADEGTTTIEYWSVDQLDHVEGSHSLDVVIDYVASGGGSGTTTSNAPCITCHGVAGAPPQMAVNFGVDAVDRATACPRCHTYGLAGTHPNHYAGGDCGAICHRDLMGPSTLAATPTKVTPYGSFASLGSKDTTSGDLHVIHASVSWAGSIVKGDYKCSSCHAPAACDACHSGGVSPMHAEHSGTGNPRYSARTPLATRVCYGVVGEDQSFDSVTETLQQCGIGECHNTAGLEEAEPTSFEDYSHAAIGSKPANTVTKTGTWITQTKTHYSMQRRSASVTKNSTLGISFTGTKVAVSGGKGPNFGGLEVSIDGVVVATINGYSATVIDKTTLFTAETLVRGPHTVSVRVTGVRPAGSSGIAVAVDEFLVWDKQPSTIAPGCTQSCHPDRSVAHGYADVDHVADAGGSIEPLSGARCDACHSMDLMTEHQRDGSVSSDTGCATCHTNPRRTFVTWNQSCQQGGCHTPGTTEQRHAGLPVAHTALTVESCTKNCHEALVPQEHAKDAGHRTAVGCVGCHTSAEYVAGVRSAPGAGWSGDCVACHPSTHSPNSAGNMLCLDCHGSSSVSIDALAGTGAWNATGGDHGPGFAGSAHGQSVAAGSDGAVPSGATCEACHNHNAIGVGAPTEFRAAGGRQTQSALCFECHSASGDETRTPVPNTWNGRDLAVEFSRPSSHPVVGTTSIGSTREETVGVFMQSTPIELAANSSFQVSVSPTMGAQLQWDSWTIPSIPRPLLFLVPESHQPNARSFSQYDPAVSAWNSWSYDPSNPAAGAAYSGSSGLGVSGKFVWSVGQGFATRMAYTPINGSSPDSWDSLSPLPFVADAHVLSAGDPDAALVYYAGNNTAGTVYRWFTPTDAWTAPFVMKSAGGTPIDFTNSDFAFSPQTNRLYVVTKNWNQQPVIRWVDSPSTASGEAIYTQQALVQPGSTWGSGDLTTGLTRFSWGGTDYLVYDGPTYEAYGYQRAYLISGLASGDHTMTALPEFPWWAGGKGTKLLWDGGEYIYALHENSGPNPGRIRIPADPLNDAWGAWEMLPASPKVYGEQGNGSMAFLSVSTAELPVTGYRASGTISAEVDLPQEATSWGELSWAVYRPLGPSVYLSVEGWDGASWIALPGLQNRTSGPVSLTGIDPSLYRRIRLTALLVTPSETVTPALRGWSVTARVPVDENSGVASLTCASCHNSHAVREGSGAWDVARVSRPGNTKVTPADTTTFCLECHSAGGVSEGVTSGSVVPYDIGFRVFDTGSFFPGWEKDTGLAAFKNSGHFTTAGTKALCENCHDPHASENPRLTAWTRPAGFLSGVEATRDNTSGAGFEENLCFQCHGNGVIGMQAPGAQDVASVASLPYRHDPTTAGVHSDAESATDNGANRHAECSDCHDPHAAQAVGDRIPGGVPAASPALLGATGLIPIWGSTPGSTMTSYTATRLLGRPGDVEAYVCFKCHTSASGRPATASSNGTPYTSTDLATEFNPNNGSFHNVLGLAKGMKDSFIVDGTTYTWALPADSTFLKPGWTRDSAVACSDCHTSGAVSSAKGPHGSSVRFLIDPAYPADYRQASLDWREADGVWPTGQVICTKCHVFSPTQNNAHGAYAILQGGYGNKIHTREYMDTMKCTSCHIAIPHGWKRPRLLISAGDPAAYRSAYARGPLNSIKLRNRTPNSWSHSDCAGCGIFAHPALSPVWP